jgi:hypothetical protein
LPIVLSVLLSFAHCVVCSSVFCPLHVHIILCIVVSISLSHFNILLSFIVFCRFFLYKLKMPF